MMIKKVARSSNRKKFNKLAIFEELLYRNKALEKACFILDELQELIRALPDKLKTGTEQDMALTNSMLILDDSLDKLMEIAGVFFDEIEMKLIDIQKYLFRNYCGEMNRFTKMVSDILDAQKRVGALISIAEEQIYKFLNLTTSKHKTEGSLKPE